jgi:hypothetical protein
MSHTPDGASAPASSVPRRRRFNFEPRPIDPALRRRRIKIARAFNLICRTKCSVMVAVRACGPDHGRNAAQTSAIFSTAATSRADAMACAAPFRRRRRAGHSRSSSRATNAEHRVGRHVTAISPRWLPSCARSPIRLGRATRKKMSGVRTSFPRSRSRRSFARAAAAPSRATAMRSSAAAHVASSIGGQSNEGEMRIDSGAALYKGERVPTSRRSPRSGKGRGLQRTLTG